MNRKMVFAYRVFLCALIFALAFLWEHIHARASEQYVYYLPLYRQPGLVRINGFSGYESIWPTAEYIGGTVTNITAQTVYSITLGMNAYSLDGTLLYTGM